MRWRVRGGWQVMSLCKHAITANSSFSWSVNYAQNASHFPKEALMLRCVIALGGQHISEELGKEQRE